MRIHPQTQLGLVHYTVGNLAKQIAFYRDVLGFKLLRQEGDEAALGTEDRELLRMTQVAGATRVRGTTGLYHTAFLFPERRDLAHLMHRIVDARVTLHGTTNHGTHLAIYLPDPEGNGIELAWDFPRENWPTAGGGINFGAAPRQGIDFDELFNELERDPSPWPGLPAETGIGHIHLRVGDLQRSKEFYHHVLGFDVTWDAVNLGALFVSAGGYHHHIGMNVWQGAGLPAPPVDAIGLRYYVVLLPDDHALDQVRARLDRANIAWRKEADGVLTRDPSQNKVLFQMSPNQIRKGKA